MKRDEETDESPEQKLSYRDVEKRILNEKNILITETVINNILKTYDTDYTIKNLSCFQMAMTDTTYTIEYSKEEKTETLIRNIPPIKTTKNVMPLQESSYECLEFLGDAVIHHIIAEYLYKRYRIKGQGFMTVLRTQIESSGPLCKLSRRIGLHMYAVFGRNIELAGGRLNNVAIMEDIFEAFMGALSLEAPHEVCYKFLTNLMEREIDFVELINSKKNYKESLMHYYHKLGIKKTPKYETIETIENGSKKTYKMIVRDPDGKIVGHGSGLSKKIGSQNAAKDDLLKYKVISSSTTNDYKNSDSDSEYYEDE